VEARAPRKSATQSREDVNSRARYDLRMLRLISKVVLIVAICPIVVLAQPREAAPTIDTLLPRLRDAELRTRQAAREDLPRIATPDMSDATAVRLLRAAAEEYPKPDAGETRLALVVAAGQKPVPALVPVARELFAKADAGLRDALLVLLLKIDDRSASTTYMDLLARHLREDDVERIETFPLREKPHDADVFFPGLFEDALQLVDATDVYNAALVYCERDLLRERDLVPQAQTLLKRYALLQPNLAAAQQPSGIAWRWTPQYAPVRDEAEILLDLFGYLPPRDVDPTLRAALAFKDPRLRLFAITSLLHHGQDVPQDAIDDAAAAAETRRWLYRDLVKMNQAQRFPKKYLTREAMAESDMVDWLTYPTELGRAPDEIELMKTLPGPTPPDGGPTDLYVFRFRTREPHPAAAKGWLAGVAGPYPREGTAPEDFGGTFSTFEPWDAKSPEEHARAVAQVLADSRDREAKDRQRH
jgi:hypothetical protein